MVEIREISYNNERLGFFADQRKLVQKRYDRLEKQIKPDEPYTSERREFLSDLGRELSFYNDVIEMLENGVVPKSEVESLKVELDAMRGAANSYKMHYENVKVEVTREIFGKIKRELREAIKNNHEVRRERIEKHGEINAEFDNLTYGKILALDGMLGFIEHLEEECENL